MRKTKLPSKWLIVGAMMVFLGTAFMSVAINVLLYRHEFNLAYSISHFVGLEFWSAIFFTFGNIFVATFMGYYLWKLGRAWKMPRIFFWLVLFLATSLIGLSIWPTGIADIGDTTSIITWLHILTSRTMFILMMIISAMIAVCKRANPLAHAANIAYLIYAVFCIAGFMTSGNWFTPLLLVYESLYIVAFMLVLAVCDNRREKLRDLYTEAVE